MNVASLNWQEEALRYDRLHPRLQSAAGLIHGFRPRSVLDVGCATAALHKLLSSDIAYYGCDITDHAAGILPAGHFRQIDFNRDLDLSSLEEIGFELIHMGGVLEYLERPGELLTALRRLVRPGTPLICSIINFSANRHRSPASHHPGWIYKPSLPDLRQLLAESGWIVHRQIPFFTRYRRVRALVYLVSRSVGGNELIMRRWVTQFILVARAV